ncbi:MAG: IPT/TIG domain-containing protein, partial [Bacteroidota bacterium]
MKNTILPKALMLWMLFASFATYAISPSNDCGTNGSQQITVNTNSCNTTSFDFNSSIGSPSLTGTCASGGSQDGWGWFNATGTSTTVTASPSGNNDRNIALMVYSGTCGSMTLVACVNATSQPDPETATFTTVNGSNYFIRVVRMGGTFSNAENDVCVTNNVAPSVTGFSPAIGCVGSVITINGTNLSSASSVKIGGTTASILSNSSTVITATVGSGTTGTVSVTTGGGTSSSGATFTVNPLPTQYNVTGGGGYCTGGAGVPVNLSNSASGVDYQLKLGAGNVGSAMPGTGAALAFGNQTTAGTYTVVATNTSTTCGRTMSGSASVSISTNAGISSQPPNRSICENANTSFSVTANGTGPFTYQWQNNSSGSMANIA